MYRFVRRRAAALGLLTGIVYLSAGCGGPQSAEVTGKVTHKGQPVTAGNVYIVAADDPERTGGGMLTGDGKFSGSAPVGRVKVAVQTGAFKPGGAKSGPPGQNYGGPPKGGPPSGGGPPKGSSGPQSSGPPVPAINVAAKTGSGGAGSGGDPPKYVAIPDKYEQIGTSGLEFDIKPGKNELNIDLP